MCWEQIKERFGPLPVVCCVCHRWKVVASGRWVSGKGRSEAACSHGYCPECAKKEKAKIRAAIAARRKATAKK